MLLVHLLARNPARYPASQRKQKPSLALAAKPEKLKPSENIMPTFLAQFKQFSPEALLPR